MARFLTFTAGSSLLFLLATTPAMAGNPTSGARVFTTQCATCHAVRAKAPPGVGPNLFGVVGRRAGTLAGYSYSPAMRSSGIVWGAAQLRTYLQSPRNMVHGNKMPYAGLHNAGQLDDLIAYLAAQH